VIKQADILAAGILIVDDQPDNVALLEQMLHEAGYVSVSSTTDPRTVCDLHLRYRYDLILLDLQMPCMDGFEVMEGLKKIEPGGCLPVLVITAQPGQKVRALKAGARDFVSKPFDLTEVLVRVQNMLEVRLLHQNENFLNSARLENSQRMALLGDWEYDFAGGGSVWSEEMYRILGVSKKDRAPSLASYLLSVHPDDLAFVSLQTDLREEVSRRRDFEHRIRRPNGQVRHVRHIAEAVLDGRGRPLRESGTVQDITERKLSEYALSASEERFRRMLMLSPDAHLVHIDGIITFVNRAFCQLTGAAEPAQWVGRSVLDVIDPDSHSFLRKPRRKAADVVPPSLSRIKFVRIDGIPVAVDASHVELDLPGRTEMQLTASVPRRGIPDAGPTRSARRRVRTVA
jgi:PAS domain S-box-containing protein